MVIFAGPNGSGKSSVIKQSLETLQGENRLPYLNADAFEKHLKEHQNFDFNSFGLIVEDIYLKNYLQKSSLINQKICIDKSISVDEYLSYFNVESNILFPNKVEQDSYFAAAIVDFLINEFIDLGKSFSFETVMSHKGKNDIINKAKANGFEIKLLFVTTIDPEINISRVSNRVAKGGHNVPKDKIIERYFRSLDNLSETLKIVDEAYLYDNSGSFPILIAEKRDNLLRVKIISPPEWYFEYVEDKFLKK